MSPMSNTTIEEYHDNPQPLGWTSVYRLDPDQSKRINDNTVLKVFVAIDNVAVHTATQLTFDVSKGFPEVIGDPIHAPTENGIELIYAFDTKGNVYRIRVSEV